MSLLLVLLSLSLCYFSPGEVFPSLSPYHIQQVLLLPAIAASIPGLMMRNARLPSPHYILMVGLWFAVVVSLLQLRWIHGSFDAFLDFGVIVIVYFLVLINAYTPSRIRIFCGMIILCAVVMSILGVLAYYTGYDEEKLLHTSLEEGVTVYKRIRAYGILNDANDLGQFLLVALAMLGMFWKRQHFIRNIMLLIAPAGILIFGIYLTGSRGAMLGLAVIVFVLASSRIGKLQSAILAGFIFVLLIFGNFGAGRQISVNEASAAGRVMAWGSGISFLRANPLFGVGFEQFTEANELTAHNSFVLCFSELGFFGYFFWLAMVVTSVLGLQHLSRAPLKTPADYELRRCVTTLRTAFYCFLSTSWFLSRTYNITLYVLLALAAALIHYHRQLDPEAAVATKRWVALTLASQAASIALIYATVRIRTL